MIGVHKDYLDFEILETGNTKTLVFMDSSQYMKPPDRPLLEVFLPGFNKYLLTNVVPSQLNTFNANTLGLSQTLNVNFLQDLPDGVWEFKYKICPYDLIYIVKKHMRITMLTNKLRALYNDINLDGCDCPDQTSAYINKQLTQINVLIRGSQLVVNKDSKKASKYYKLADKLIGDLVKKFCKNCNQWGATAGQV